MVHFRVSVIRRLHICIFMLHFCLQHEQATKYSASICLKKYYLALVKHIQHFFNRALILKRLLIYRTDHAMCTNLVVS